MDSGGAVTPALARGKRLTLALNAAEGALQMVFADAEGHLVYGLQAEAASRGAEFLAPSIHTALSLMGEPPAAITRIAAVNGPGSFTGLRLATATASGLARATGANLAGIGYMQLVARQCLPLTGTVGPNDHLWVLVRARRDLVYMQAFVRAPESPVPLLPITGLEVCSVAAGDAARLILDTAVLLNTPRVLLGGSGVQNNRDALVRSLAGSGAPRMTMLPPAPPTLQTLLELAMEANYGTEDIGPLYARASDAEENLPEIAARLGLDPDDAVRKLKTLTRAVPGA